MMEKIVLEEKEKETLYHKLEEVGPIEDFYYKEYEEEGKLFKSKKYKLCAIRKEDVKKYIQEYLKEIGNRMKIEIHTEIRESEGILNVGIISNHSSILIGKEGKNIDALQVLLRQAITNITGMAIRINLDVCGYKLKKQKRLEREIKNIAREVLHSKIDVKLDPMNSYDRRIVHSLISQYDHLETESIGEAPNRYVTIKYKEK